jgi:uncharacterized protein YecE (DUF72 family)
MLMEWAQRIREAMRTSGSVWVIFDNTARGEAYPNALRMRELLLKDPGPA